MRSLFKTSAVALLAAVLLTACGTNDVTGPTATVAPTVNPCAAFVATPAVVLTQGVLTASTVVRTEARWCESNAPVVQVLEFNPGTFTGGVNAALVFTQEYAQTRPVTLPAGVVLVGGPRGL